MPVDRVVARDVRRDAHATQVGGEAAHIVGLVRRQRQAALARRMLLEHGDGRLPLRSAGRLRQHRLHDEARAVLHQRVPHIGELRRLPVSLAIELGIGIRRRGVRLVAALLAMVGALAVEARRRRLITAVLGAKAL